ncbi:MAG: hypothetical protein ACRCV9_00865 [Burkholderiaceae bacterium]
MAKVNVTPQQDPANVIAARRLLSIIEEGLLTRNRWKAEDEQGRILACALTAAAPICGKKKSAAFCPAEIMPSWLAHLVPWMSDSGTISNWLPYMRRFAAILARLHVIDDSRLELAHKQILAAFVREAMLHTKNEKALTVCESIAATLESGLWPVDKQCAGAAAAAAAAAAGARGAREAARAARAAAAEAADRMIDSTLLILESKIVEADRAVQHA